ncbi:MAG TPA: tRNA (adenosine(37)-N6)-threonylcarbamoyltransferase complex ATPase subunit type 1 TsaE [Candidatus Peribacteraceae bacterium]|nr:tRNA (adenosine(37)-N6)-threonylcarbamoyltransferase complex ATPase subunit type 1 TsaE [Candidatus Peribacteraceae bacterium]
MISTLQMWLENPSKTRSAGRSLAHTVYHVPVTICLTGDLGAGKTTFLQGLAEELGIAEHVSSPTYALEQRYITRTGRAFLHLDLYRLSPSDAAAIVDGTDDEDAIRCIEWADKLPDTYCFDRSIRLHFEESGDGRALTVNYDDMPLPDLAVIETWRRDARLPAHIIRHCDAVADVAAVLADRLTARGDMVRKDALIAAARVHDLFRFIDFRGAGPPGVTETEDERQAWDSWKKRFADMRHEAACATFLQEKGFPEIATIVSTHGLMLPQQEFMTIEQKLLFYADKRVANDRITSISERFTDFSRRYSHNQLTDKHLLWFEQTQKLEKELFPEGAPVL